MLIGGERNVLLLLLKWWIAVSLTHSLTLKLFVTFFTRLRNIHHLLVLKFEISILYTSVVDYVIGVETGP